jgi:hypothetical protein
MFCAGQTIKGRAKARPFVRANRKRCGDLAGERGIGYLQIVPDSTGADLETTARLRARRSNAPSFFHCFTAGHERRSCVGLFHVSLLGFPSGEGLLYAKW